MNGYLAFTKKEVLESLRNYKAFSLLALFLIIGIISPLTAKLMPELMQAMAPDLQVTLATPTALDSWTQFYKNSGSLGISLMLIIFCGLLSGEYAKGTLVIMLTKGLPRRAVILAKFSVVAMVMSVSFWAGFLTTYGYTAYLWPGAGLSHLLFAGFAMWVAALLYLSVLVLGCVLCRQAFGSILFLLAVTAVIALLALPQRLAPYSPNVLLSQNVDLLSGAVAPGDFMVPLAIAAVVIVGCLLAALALFEKKPV